MDFLLQMIADTPNVPKKGGGFRAYLNREAPKALGSKEIPVVNMMFSNMKGIVYL